MHIPVLQKEVIKYLDPNPGDYIIDATINGGGHSSEILKMIMPGGRLLGIDLDKDILKNLELKIKDYEFKKRIILINDNFKNLDLILKKVGDQDGGFKPDGILMDLGMSSLQLDESGRGFSFLRNEVLDMRFSTEQLLTAYEIVNSWRREDLENIFLKFGKERFFRNIAATIYKERKKKKIATTYDLREIIIKSVPSWYLKKKIDPATKTFQALRIVVNDELNNLESGLKQAINNLKNNGRLLIISFHSLEDKIVKDFFRTESINDNLKILTKKPVVPTREESKQNPRARSAKLRAAASLKL